MSTPWLNRIGKRLADLWETVDQVTRSKAVERVEAELEELEYIFALLSQGAFIGMPSPPVQISLDLLPAMEKDLVLLMERVQTANEPMSRLFSVFDIS